MDIFGGDSKVSMQIVCDATKLSLLTAAAFFSMKWIMNNFHPHNKIKRGFKKRAKEQMRRLSNQEFVLNIDKLSEYEVKIATQLIHPEDIEVTWDDIAGLEPMIQELRETIILPLQKQHLFNDTNLLRAPKGVLLYGPPGCGKTLIAKATAKEAKTRFINLDISILTDKWYGESQKLASAVFSLAAQIQPCILFIDEIDSFLRVRNREDHEVTAAIKAQFMSLWDGLTTDPHSTIIVMGATNRPQDLDGAILRRMPATFHVPLPNAKQRTNILNLILTGEPIDQDVDTFKLAKETEMFSGSDLKELCRSASICRVREFMQTEDELSDDNSLRQISMQDLSESLTKMKQSKINSYPLSCLYQLD